MILSVFEECHWTHAIYHWIYSIPLKHIVTAAHYNGKIQRNPFAMYHVDPDHKEREFLTEEELDIFAGIELEIPTLLCERLVYVWLLDRYLFR